MRVLLTEHTILSLDDDHLRSRSRKNTEVGFVRKNNPKKGFGADHHGITSVGTNAILCGHVECRGEGVQASVKHLVDTLRSHSNSFTSTLSNDAVHDRGYGCARHEFNSAGIPTRIFPR